VKEAVSGKAEYIQYFISDIPGRMNANIDIIGVVKKF
jgi:hypothetical protein